jgi:hypothetical protein
MPTDPAKLQAALEQLETERQRRIDERVEKGEAIRVPSIVVGAAGSVNAEKARRLAELREAGETREIIFGFKHADGSDAIEVIVTGVPRRGRDDGADYPRNGGPLSRPQASPR